MFFSLYFGIVAAEILILGKKRDNIVMEFDVLGDKICKGYLKPIGGENSTFKAIISSTGGSVFFSNNALPVDTETHFSFNVKEQKTLTMTLTPVAIDKERPHTSAEIDMKFETQFDTFRKDVARKVSVEPAMVGLTKLQNLIRSLLEESDYLARGMGSVDYEHRRLFSFVVISCVVMLLVYFILCSYELHSSRKFFTMKKII